MSGKVTRSMADRFWEKVEQRDPDECWPWLASKGNSGYGTFTIDGRRASQASTTAHRVAYELVIGPIPEGSEIDHLCRNKFCVNPAHLEAVTHLENMRRAYRGQTSCLRGHPFDGDNVRWSRVGRRECRACRRIRGRVAGARRRSTVRFERARDMRGVAA